MDRARIARSAARAHGVLLPRLLEAEGVSLKQRRSRVASGEWRRLPNGILVVAGVPETFEMVATAALAAMPTAALSHVAAARVVRFGLRTCSLHLSVEAGGRNRLRGAIVHQTTFDTGDVVRRRGFRVTSIERTLVDLGSLVAHDELLRCIEDQVITRRTTLARVVSVFERRSGSGIAGTTRFRRVLDAIDGEPPTESELESMFVRLGDRHDLPIPTRQAHLDWMSSERGRVDFWYPKHHLIVELDGRRFHARVAAFEHDRRRDQRALVNGVRTVRISHRQLTGDPESVVDVLRSLTAATGSSG